MNKHWITGSLAVLLLAICGAWALGFFSNKYSDDPEVAAVEKLREEKFANPDSMSDEQMRDAGEAMREQAKNLSPEQRRSLWERSAPFIMPMMMKQMEVKLDEFLALSPEQQRAEIDKRIDEQLSRQKARNANGGTAQTGGGGPGGKGGRPNISPQKVDEFKKKMNDWTTPDQRAKFELVIDMTNKRREQRGLDPVGPGRWR